MIHYEKDDTEVEVRMSCTATLNNEMWIFGGYDQRRQVNFKWCLNRSSNAVPIEGISLWPELKITINGWVMVINNHNWFYEYDINYYNSGYIRCSNPVIKRPNSAISLWVGYLRSCQPLKVNHWQLSDKHRSLS